MLAIAKRDINLCSKMVEEDDPDTSKKLCEEMALNTSYVAFAQAHD